MDQDEQYESIPPTDPKKIGRSEIKPYNIIYK
jgi:hypothetical protein